MGFLRLCRRRVWKCVFLLLNGFAQQVIQQAVVRRFVGFLLLGGRRGGFVRLGLRNVPLDGNGIDRRQLEALHDAVDLGRILGTHHNVYHTVSGTLFATQGTVDNTVSFGFGCKLFQMLLADGKHFQLLAAFEHGGEPLVAFGLVLISVFPDSVEHGGDILCRRAGQLQGNFRTLQADPHDLLRCVTGIVHISSSPSCLENSLANFV